MNASRASALEQRLRGRLREVDGAAQMPEGVPAAVLVLLIAGSGGELRTVLTRRASGLRKHPNEIAFPGGRQETGHEHLSQTALREAAEEIGLDRGSVDLVGALEPRLTAATRFAVHPFVGLLKTPQQWRPSHEVGEVLEISIESLRGSFGHREIAPRGTPFCSDCYYVGPHLVWGVTAEIATSLLDCLATEAPTPPTLI
ncbi:MAG: NUDIX hydrolase [Solirubrobacteraceae bacterium]